MMLTPNKAVLEQVFPELYKRLLKEAEILNQTNIDIQLVTTPSGDISMKYRGIWIHSSRNPREEAKRVIQTSVQSAQVQNQTPFILLGFGLGYTAEHIREQYPQNPLVIIEPNPSILLTALTARDLSSLLCSPGIIFIIDKTMGALFNVLPLFSSPPLPIISRPYREAEPDVVKDLLHILSLWKTKTDVNEATIKKFGKRWVKNIVANQHILIDIPGIAAFAEAFPSFPALVLAAGPSLDDILPFLPELHKRCLIIAVDTALRALLRSGIEPDFVVVVDPQYWNARHLDFCHALRTCLVTEIGVYPTVLRHSFQHRLLCSSLYPLGYYLEKNVDVKGRLGAGGSVATTAFDFALHLGSKPIYIAGLDLSYPDYKTHFTGALFEERAFTKSHRFLPAETQSFQSLMGAHPFYAPSASGDKVLTDARLSLYTAWFEARLRQLPPGICKSLSPNGIGIPGLELGSVEDLLSRPVIRLELQNQLSNIIKQLEDQFFAADHQKHLQQAWEKNQQTLIQALTDLLVITERGTALVNSLLQEMMQGSINLLDNKLTELDRINDQIAQSPIKDIAGFLFTDSEENKISINNSQEKDALQSYLTYLTSFYSILHNSINYQILLLKSH
ncbi:motility associated factor glycosyltransferase family protein [Gracilinema caldarium]|uniref:6-hydroxymethylpterin diphosphokinase MptE-like domain-containing protein n=1 Tax=Gracilinema caldarium (strain ATCC 51460 / DSM 7334 / H1) TaxID=744872 RepID=F8F1M9_GRAC1|nr:6-hydroxymethylpterin diphosphokinase MptE-like protein [Gracilinema caldarium]AEJ19363.1 protein of unknown function DUF115 [Gracilinema caldarium DSM 7334]